MPISPEDFRERVKAKVLAHYATTRVPLLLASLGAEIEREDAWPTNRGQQSLKQLIEEFSPELGIVRDKHSPAYIAVVTPDVRADVEAQIAQRFGENEVPRLRLEDIAKPVLLAFCVNVETQSVYVKRTRPFRYEVGAVLLERASDYILVEPEYRRPGLRIDNPQLLSPQDRKDLESRIQRWATVHGIRMEQFSRLDTNEREAVESGRTALDRLLAAQPPDVASRVMIPADIAQLLSRMR